MLNTLKIFIRLLFSSFFLTFGDMVSLCGPGQPGTCYVDQVGLKLRDYPTGPKGPSPCPANTAIFFRLGCSFSCSDFFLFWGGVLCIFCILVLYHMHSRQRISSTTGCFFSQLFPLLYRRLCFREVSFADGWTYSGKDWTSI